MKKTALFTSFLVAFSSFIASAQTVEWKDVASIFYANCATCHRHGEIGDGFINTMGYDSLMDPVLSPYFYAIKSYVNAKLMPPWKADPDYHHYIDERILTPQEITLIDSFVDQAPRVGYDPGDLSLAPDPPVFAAGSQLGTPDTVLKMAQAFTIPGNNIDHYQCFVLHTNLDTDRNVKAIEFRAGNPKIVHHVFIYTCSDSSADAKDDSTAGYGYSSFGGAGTGVNADFLTLYGPGLTPRFYPSGSGLKFKKGTAIIIQVHYAPTTVEQTDQSSLNIFYDSVPNIRQVKGKRVGEHYILEPQFFIKKGKVFTFHSAYTLDTTFSMFSIAPHMHLLGKEFKIWAVTPDGDSIPLCHVPAWDFRWQLLYNFPCYIILPQYTVIHSEATYDNTIGNPNNPNNPPVNVEYGESTTDEMDKYFMNLLSYQPGDENVICDTALCALTDVSPIDGIVSTSQLYNPIPNPANESATIQYYLPMHGTSRIFFYDLLGRIALPTMEEVGQAPGLHRNTIDVKDMVPGIYLVVLATEGRSVTKLLVVEH